MTFLERQQAEIVENLYSYFSDQLVQNPQAVLEQVDRELQALYVRYGNDWTGRGVVGDSTQEATIAGLEAVRAECLDRVCLQAQEGNRSFSFSER